jgi:acyl-CoA synthetase (AMP-forming)/AMP-acid ligase II/acyl carrier protein
LLPLTGGLKVLVADESQQKDPTLLRKMIPAHRVEIVQMTPSRLQLLLKAEEDLAFLEGVEALILGGEALPAPLCQRVKKEFPGKFYNVYGPTETTVWSTLKDLSNSRSGELTIGRPLANTRVYIVDRFHCLQPLGVSGELSIGGDGVAAGYLNNPALTCEKFIHHPFQKTKEKSPGKKAYRSHMPHVPSIYKTGDLARWLLCGEIEFLGRIDHQVKIRGFRIQLEEIQEQLASHDEIREAVVTARENSKGDKYLCAYLVAGVGHKVPTADRLREYLSRRLPDYMLPALFVSLEKIPLTPSGKTDVKSLPEPSWLRPQLKEAYNRPGTEIEQEIASAWQEVLELERVGIDDNFFDLGGNSMAIVTIINRLRRELGKEIPMISMFRYRTIRSLALVLNREHEANISPKDRGEAMTRGEMRKKQRLQARKRKVK